MQTTACTATVTGTNGPSQAVIWSIGPTTVGAISTAGVFTPAAAGVETIIAKSVQDPTQSGSATVTVSVPVTISGVTVTCSPMSILTTQTANCIPNVTGSGNYTNAVNWFVNGVASGNSSVGTISTSGLYTAPAVIPAGGNSIAITGTSQEDGSKSGTAAIFLAYPSPTLSTVSPGSVAAGAPDTPIEVAGSAFTSQSLVYFDSLALQTSFVSSSQLSAVIPTSQLASAGVGVVTVTTPAPGGGTSSAAQFTITPLIAAAKLVLLASPAYSGSPGGPWQLSIAAADSNGSPVPNLPVTVSSSEGTITQNSMTTDSTGTLTASITPPTSYAGEVVEVSAASGNQNAVVDLTFAASSTSVNQQAAVVINRNRAQVSMGAALPHDSSSSTSSSSGINQLMIGTSNGGASSNVFSGMLSLCTSNQELDTTIPVDCQNVFKTNQIQNTPFSPGNNACQQVSTYKTLAECAGAAGIAIACASPESGVGPVICAGGLTAGLPQSCVLDLGKDIAESLIKNQLANATVDLVTTDIDPEDPTSYVDVLCDAYAAGNAGTAMSVSPSTATVSLGRTVTLNASQAASWQVVGSNVGTSLGTVSPTSGTSVTYYAPSVAPQGTYCNFLSPYVDSCPITIVATSTNPPTVQTVTTLLLSIGSNDTPPVIQSLAPNPVAAGSSALELSINGSGFLAGDTVTFDGSQRTPVFIGPNQLQIPLSVSDLAIAGAHAVVVSRDYLAIASSNGSSMLNLIVNSSSTAVPPAPTPTSPGTPTDTGATVSSTIPTLQWTGTGATQYDLAISQYPYGTSNVVFDSGTLNGGQTSLAVPAGHLSGGTKYRWNMMAYDSAGWSPVSSSLYFTVSTVPLPTEPSLITPGTSTDTGYSVSTTPTMQWSGSGATQYELAISQSPYGSSNVVYDSLLAGSASSQPIPSGYLQNGTKYRWDMQATNAAGQSSWSAPLYFTVSGSSSLPPPVPTPTSPGTATDTGFLVSTMTPTMQWSGSGATQYELAISQSPYGSSNVVYDTVLAGTASTQPIPSGYLQNGVKYRWDMQATNAAGQSSWSGPLYFTVSAAVLTPAVSSVSPNPVPGSNSAQTLTINGSNFVSGATLTYHDTLGNTYSGRAANFVSSSQLVDPAFNDASDAGSWTVTVVNPGGSSSSAHTFTVN
jgi:hypothetical protein